MDYQLKRARRKTLAIAVLRDGTLEVRAPLQLSKREIEAFLAQKRDWIAERQTQARLRAAQQAGFSIKPGDTLRLIGRQYPVLPAPAGKSFFDGTALRLSSESFDQNRPCVIAACRELVRVAVEEAVARYGPQMEALPRCIKITGAKTRWGSCSSKGNVNFSWRLAMAERDALDYVVVHELAHLKELNHSARFWALVAAILPDYRARQALLRDAQARLEREGW